jgi:hypothetical protein
MDGIEAKWRLLNLQAAATSMTAGRLRAVIRATPRVLWGPGYVHPAYPSRPREYHAPQAASV